MSSPGMQSKIDTLPVEELRVFSKKQMLMLKQLKVKMDTISKDKTAAVQKIDEITSEKKQFEEEIECLKQKSSTLELTLRESSGTQKQSDEMEFQYEELKLKYEEQNEKMEKFREMFNSRLDTATEEKEQLRGELQDLIDAKDIRIGELEHLFTEEKEQLRVELQDVIDTRGCRIAELEHDLFNEDKENSLAELEEECGKLHNIISDLNDEREQMSNTIRSSELKTTELGQENIQLKKSISKLEDSMNTLPDTTENDQLQEKINHLEGENSEITSRIETLIADAECKTEEFRRQEEKSSSLLSQVEKLKTMLEEMKAQASDDRALCTTLSAEKDDLANQIKMFTAKNLSSGELEATLSGVEHELKVTRDALEFEKQSNRKITGELKQNTSNMQKELDRAQKRISDALAENDAIVKQFEGRLQEASQREEKLNITLEERNTIEESLRKSLEELQTSFDKLQNVPLENNEIVSSLEDKLRKASAKEKELEKLFEELKIARVSEQHQGSTDDEGSTKKIQELEGILQRSAEEMAFIKSKLVRLDDLEKMELKFGELSDTNKKLKLLALKSKKEVDEMKKKVQAEKSAKEEVMRKLKASSSKASNATSSFQAENDRLQDEVDRLGAQLQALNTHLAEIREENDANSSAINEKETATRELDRITQKLKEKECRLDEALEREVQLDAQNLQEKRARMEEKSSLIEKLTKAEKAFEVEKTRRAQSVKELEDTKEDFKTQQLINMEMKDYERSVSELKRQVEVALEEAASAKKDGNQLQDLLDQVRQRAKAAEDALESADDRVEKYRNTIEATNNELTELRDKEMHTRTEIMQSSSAGEHLKGQLEELKLQIATKDAELVALQTKNEQSDRKLSREKVSLEKALTDKNEEFYALTEEHETQTKEFEQYKVRVHSVLKQQRQSTTDPAQLEQAKHALMAAHEEIKRLNNLAEDNNSKQEVLLLETEKWKHQAQSNKSQLIEVETQYSEKEKLLVERANRTETELLDAKTKSMNLESELLRIREESRKNVEDAQFKERNEFGLKLSLAERRAAQAEADLFKLRQISKAQEDAESEKRPFFDRSPKIDPLRTERSEPIGAERDDDRSDVISLEQIIHSPPSMSQRSESMRVFERRNEEQIRKLTLKLEHANSILAESEETNSRLADQSSILKTEIRRLEKNQERETNIHNLEYLKNIILKFMTLTPGTERTGLIPVLDTMLQLEPAEKNKLVELAGTEDDEGAEGSWGSFLPRWGGL